MPEDSPLRSQTSCLLPPRRLRSLASPSWFGLLKKPAPLLGFLRTAHSVSNPLRRYYPKSIKKTPVIF